MTTGSNLADFVKGSGEGFTITVQRIKNVGPYSDFRAVASTTVDDGATEEQISGLTALLGRALDAGLADFNPAEGTVSTGGTDTSGNRYWDFRRSDPEAVVPVRHFVGIKDKGGKYLDFEEDVPAFVLENASQIQGIKEVITSLTGDGRRKWRAKVSYQDAAGDWHNEWANGPWPLCSSGAENKRGYISDPEWVAEKNAERASKGSPAKDDTGEEPF